MRREITGGLTWRSRALLLLLPMVAVVAALSIGRVGVPVSYIFDSVLDKLGMQAAELMTQYESVLWKFRLPRILLSLLVGAGLSVSGCAFQSLFSNPLATPDTLGVASGTSFGAALALLLGFGMLGVQAMALFFGIAAVALTYLAGSGKGRSSMGMMILSGIMVGSLFTALISLIKFTADTESQLPVITYWLMGSMSAAGYDSLLLGAPLIVLGIAVLYLLRWRLNILLLSDDEARASGMNVKAMRIVTVLCATGITASCVSMCGQVGWVGLLVPHMCRMKFGNNHLALVPASACVGAAFLAAVDTLARSISSAQIPVSALTAVIGAPFFMGLFDRNPDVIASGVGRAHACCLFFFLLAFSHCIAGIMRGAGKASVPMLVMLVSWCVIRVIYITVTIRFIPSIAVIYWAYPITWVISSAIFLIYFLKSDWVHAYEKQGAV